MSEITVDYLLSEADSEHTYYALFVQSYKKNSQNLYCFFEGYDDVKYYRIRIQNFTQKDIDEWFYCGGKDNVINAYKLIKQHSEYDLSRILFFIDKDFSDIIEISNQIYVTPYYAIENFYTQRDVLKAIIKDEFKVRENCSENNDFRLIFEIYDKLISDFHNEILFFNAWLACQNEKREKFKEKKRLHIDNKVKKYFNNIVLEDLQTIADLSDLNNIDKLKELFPNAHEISEVELNSKIEEFKQKDGCKFFRGKFELHFFVSFLNRIKEELGKKSSSIFSKKYKISLRIEFSNAISVLSQYAETPECLINYLEKFKKAA